jgi:signal transduction histidine kinase
MIKLIKQLLTLALGKNERFNFEERLVLSSIIFLCIMSIIGIIINVYIDLGSSTIIIAVSTLLIYICVYVSARIYRKTYLAKLILSIYTLILCNLFWAGNFGSKGPAIYTFLPYFSIMVFLWNNKQIKILSIIIFLNIILLLVLELYIPGIIKNYPTEQARIIDSYSGLFMFMGVQFIMVVYAKNNYILEFERAKRSDMLKSAFLANMSHEIRTPLNAILGFTKLLVTRENSKEKKEIFAKVIVDNGNYLMQIISDILDISMIEAGQLKIQKKDVNINALIRKIYNNQNNILIEAKRIEVKFILDIPNKEYILFTDELRVEQILINIIGNAIKFTNNGYIKIGYTQEKEFLRFFVEDTGIGIKPAFQNEIFNRFVKSNETLSNNFLRGAGIGLALTKELVQILGGKIWFTSEYLKGSQFYFTLPLNE